MPLLITRVLPLCLLLAACNTHPPAPSASERERIAAAVPSPSAASSTSAPPGACTALCEITQALKCGKSAADCQAACLPMLGVSPCGAEMNAVLACMLREPQPHWQCGSDGMAELRDGYCDAEQSAFARCMHPG